MTDLILGSVYSPTASVGAYTQSILNTLWWKCFLELGNADNTLFWDDSNLATNPYNTDGDSSNDLTLTDLAKKNQVDNVQLLAGVFNETGTAIRAITVDAKANLFFPIINTVWTPSPLDDPVYGYPAGNTPEVIASLIEGIDAIDRLAVSINGVAIPEPFSYRQNPSLLDTFSFKTGGLVEDPNYPVLGPTVSGGYYMGLSPLPPELEGHTIHFSGAVGDVFALDITYKIRYEFNEVLGTNSGDSNLRGTDKSDKIEGLNGSDTLIGLEGNDNLNGGDGFDILIGVNPFASAPGAGEIDILYGGNASDTFVLEDNNKVYYLGGGLRDYALIQDFGLGDTIQLNSSQNYTIVEATLSGKSGTAISLGDDLIAFFEGRTSLLLGTSGDDTALINDPTSTIPTDGVRDILFTGAGEDKVDLAFAANFLVGGHNRVNSGSGNDLIDVNKNDRVFGSSGNDIFDATDGQGGNRMSGGDDNDIFYLGVNDRALGGAGNDEFYVQSGVDNLLAGGLGNDQFWLVDAELPVGINRISDFELGRDVIGISIQGLGFSDLTLTASGNSTLIGLGGQNFGLVQNIAPSSLGASNFVFVQSVS